uniref:Uncharacterized protein n=1 Tax=viral metagenome TaxID=1070528 RepID=A0A6H1ZXH7_9ZZZZ
MSNSFPQQVGELEQRIMVFSKAFQDLIQEIMRLKQSRTQLEDELRILKDELIKLRRDIESTARTLPKKEKIKRKYMKAKHKVQAEETLPSKIN